MELCQNPWKQLVATWYHLQQHSPEMDIDDAVEDEVKGEVDDLENIAEGSDS